MTEVLLYFRGIGMTRPLRFIYFLFSSVLLLLLITLVALGQRAKAAPTGFSFAAAGDHAANSRASSSLDLLGASGVNFYLALGDMSYSHLVPESAWCDYVKSHVGANFPFEVLAGNHEDDGPDGLIENFAACLPDRIGNISGEYGKEYYFDYPPADPIARFILVSPNLTFSNGQKYTYTAGTARYNGLADTIDGARIAGLRWVIVGMHENCLTIGTKPCEIGADLLNLLISKKVDLVLQAHDHSYQRSKQFALSPACPAVPVGVFNANCIVDDGLDDLYTGGNGTVFVINGAFGAELYDLNLLDPEIDYFAKWMGLNANPRFGFMKYTVSDTGISAEFVGSTVGSFTDNFTILASAATFTPPPTPTKTLIPSITPTATSTNTSPPGSASLTFAVEADARVKQASPATNYGSLTYLSVDGAPDPMEESYLRFNVSGVGGAIQSAKLRVYVNANGTSNGPAVQLAGNAWTESTMTWNTKPSLLSSAVDNKGTLPINTWVVYDVTPLLNGNGTYTFALIADGTDGAEFSSREGAFPAQLVVTYSTSGSTSTSTVSPTLPPANTSTLTSVPTATITPVPSVTSTFTSLSTATHTPSVTLTFATPDIPTDIPTSTYTATPTRTFTLTPTPTATNTLLPTLTHTATSLPSQTATATNAATATAIRTSAPTNTAMADLIFADGFEAGNISSWSSAVTDGSDLSVNATAALVGSQGLRAVINNTASIYVTDDRPNAEMRYRARFYFDPNSIGMSSGSAHYVFSGYSGTSTEVLRVEFRRSSGLYQLRAAARNDKSTWSSTNWFTISDAPHVVEFDWGAATTTGANNGSLTFWIDGVQQANLTGMDNDTRRIDRVRLGAVSGLDSGTLGTYYFDAFESRRQTYIGPAP